MQLHLIASTDFGGTTRTGQERPGPTFFLQGTPSRCSHTCHLLSYYPSIDNLIGKPRLDRRDSGRVACDTRARSGGSPLAAELHPPGAQKLAGSRRAFRIRQGGTRVVYEIVEAERRIVIAEIGHRREVCR